MLDVHWLRCCRVSDQESLLTEKSMNFILLFVLSNFYGKLIYADEASISTNGDVHLDQDHTSNKNCTYILSGKVNTCATYQIATLNASPRRCIHIESLPPSEEDKVEEVCMDYPKWHDGTNGCSAYAKNAHFCKNYGSLEYPSTPFKPIEACCACGGGNKSIPRLRVGDSVVLGGNNPMKSCKDLVIDRIEAKPAFRYVVKVKQACGMVQKYFNGQTIVANYQYPEGSEIHIDHDDPDMIQQNFKVELRKCRHGVKAQEFTFQQGSDDTAGIIAVHKNTERHLSSMVGAVGDAINLTQVWDDGLFDGSGDYFVSCSLYLYKAPIFG